MILQCCLTSARCVLNTDTHGQLNSERENKVRFEVVHLKRKKSYELWRGSKLTHLTCGGEKRACQTVRSQSGEGERLQREGTDEQMNKSLYFDHCHLKYDSYLVVLLSLIMTDVTKSLGITPTWGRAQHLSYLKRLIVVQPWLLIPKAGRAATTCHYDSNTSTHKQLTTHKHLCSSGPYQGISWWTESFDLL